MINSVPFPSSEITFIEPFIFMANKPFLYLIYDKEYENIIFIGKYMGL